VSAAFGLSYSHDATSAASRIAQRCRYSWVNRQIRYQPGTVQDQQR